MKMKNGVHSDLRLETGRLRVFSDIGTTASTPKQVYLGAGALFSLCRARTIHKQDTIHILWWPRYKTLLSYRTQSRKMTKQSHVDPKSSKKGPQRRQETK